MPVKNKAEDLVSIFYRVCEQENAKPLDVVRNAVKFIQGWGSNRSSSSFSASYFPTNIKGKVVDEIKRVGTPGDEEILVLDTNGIKKTATMSSLFPDMGKFMKM